MPYNITTGILFLITLAVILIWYLVYVFADVDARRFRRLHPSRKDRTEKARLSFRLKHHPMEKKDRLPVILITVVYLIVALINLGTLKDPETFAHLTSDNPTATIWLSEETEISDLWYYTGLYSGSTYEVAYSSDGENWTVLDDTFQRYNTLFKWHDLSEEMAEEDSETHTPYGSFPITAQYLRFELIDGEDIALGEVVLFDADGNRIDSNLLLSGDNGSFLIDEPDQVPETISFMNSTYFDEVYHARTAYEHLNGVYPYEDSHPPLGKLVIALGITLFGMNTFGWRIMGTLVGAAMLPILYIFLKNLFGRTPIAVCGTILFATDFMHFTQTRIATIDSYSVLWVLLSFYFLYRYFCVPETAPMKKQLIPLGLCGLSFGIGAASKWTVIYAGVGLCVLYFWRLILIWIRHKKGDGFYPWMFQTILWSILFFIVIPGIIYTLSYIPYAIASGNSVIYEMVHNQVFMFTYHNGVHQEHPYSSRWWQWLIDARPILYYSKYNDDGTKAAIGAFANPVLCWGGLISVATLLVHTAEKKSGTALFLFIAWFAELFPWLLIGRTTFEYHYFGCILFLVFGMAYIMNETWTLTRGRLRWPMYMITGYSAALFALFYPVLSGLTVNRNFCINALKWFESWPWG